MTSYGAFSVQLHIEPSSVRQMQSSVDGAVNELLVKPANQCRPNDESVKVKNRPIAELVEHDFSVLQYLSVCVQHIGTNC